MASAPEGRRPARGEQSKPCSPLAKTKARPCASEPQLRPWFPLAPAADRQEASSQGPALHLPRRRRRPSAALRPQFAPGNLSLLLLASAPESATPRPQFMPGNLSLLLLAGGSRRPRLPAANRASQSPVTFAVAVGSQAGRPSGLQFCFFSVRAWVRTEKKQFFCLRGKP